MFTCGEEVAFFVTLFLILALIISPLQKMAKKDAGGVNFLISFNFSGFGPLEIVLPIRGLHWTGKRSLHLPSVIVFAPRSFRDFMWWFSKKASLWKESSPKSTRTWWSMFIFPSLGLFMWVCWVHNAHRTTNNEFYLLWTSQISVNCNFALSLCSASLFS